MLVSEKVTLEFEVSAIRTADASLTRPRSPAPGRSTAGPERAPSAVKGLPWLSRLFVSTMPCCSSPTWTGRCASTPTCSAWTVIAREPRANAAFLRLPRSGNHHDLGLFGVGTAGGPKRRGAIGLYHLAWQLDTIDELAAARQALLDAGAYTGESSHGATKSVYGADPDGNEFELMWMLPRDEWGPYENAAPIDHLDLAGEVRRWSGVRTAGRIARGDDPEEDRS